MLTPSCSAFFPFFSLIVLVFLRRAVLYQRFLHPSRQNIAAVLLALRRKSHAGSQRPSATNGHTAPPWLLSIETILSSRRAHSPILSGMLSLSSLSLILLQLCSAFAVRFPFHVRNVENTRAARSSIFQRANSSSDSTVGISIRNSANIQYIGNITLGGNPFNVVLDTGSSDLWVAGTVPNAQDLGKSVTLPYAIGKAAGNIHTATMGFDNYTVEDQAFVLVTDTSTFSTDINAQGYQGLIGLGPNTASVIRNKIAKSSADSSLFRIFEQNKTTSNYITILLNRKGDPTEDFAGQLTPKLTIKDVPTLTDVDQHWAVFTDANGVIGPDGEPISINSIVPHVPNGKLVAVIDSGYSLPQVPRDVSDAIYGRVQGAKYDENQELWTIPCDQELNITFKFGGQSFPIHPLDTSSSDFNMTDSSTGQPVCVGTFQPITSAFSLLGEYDMILGMSFLRNTYTLIDFGNFVQDSSDSSDPYIQLLSLTDATEAHADFVKTRLNGVDTTGAASKTLLPASQESHSPESAAEKKQHREEAVLRYWPYILVGCLVFVILLFGSCIWACCRRRRNARAKATVIPIPGVQKNPYQAIHEPAPPMYMQAMGSYSDPYGHGRTSPRY
ncbi:hypothetical protein EW146_g784 [Bondarzewia mesenterica]|uniref:Peptidase A1 domain-containing protein n=1 Tax=Bondarzewia mesenterica TaxID=1095465 RepID=A0A4S4M779_9AGAM|nr:hypothetical protein EW146_g784 [Bondarzewia mesenterica]